jgi:hypothetical protein
LTARTVPVSAEVAIAAQARTGGRRGPARPARSRRQLLGLNLIDEIDLHIASILLGEGTRLYDNPAVSQSACTWSARATPPR